MIDLHGSLNAVLAADERLLSEQMGGEPAAAAHLGTVHQATELATRAPLLRRRLIGNQKDLRAYLTASLANARCEEVRVLHLNARNELLMDETVSRGCLDQAPLFPREILRRSLQVGSAGLIIVHNHPSGHSAPSLADKEATRRISVAAKTMDITLHDHLIVGNGEVCSMRELGLI